MNFSSFLARCLEKGLNDNYPKPAKYALIDIPKGLENDLPPGPRRESKMMVAAQYILLSGRYLVDYCFKTPVKGYGLDRWRRWAEKLEEIAREEGGNAELASAADDARKYMFSLNPEISLAPENG